MGGKTQRYTYWALTLLLLPYLLYLALYSNSTWATLVLGAWAIWSLPNRWKQLKADSSFYGGPGSRWIPALAAALFFTLIFIAIYSNIK